MRPKFEESRGITVPSTNAVAFVASRSDALAVMWKVAAGGYSETAALCRSVGISRLCLDSISKSKLYVYLARRIYHAAVLSAAGVFSSSCSLR